MRSEKDSLLLKKKRLERLLLRRLEAVERGDAEEMTPDEWTRMRANLIEHYKKRIVVKKEDK